jgi:hypothetical protein
MWNWVHKLDFWHAGRVPAATLFASMQAAVDDFGTQVFVIDYLNDVIVEIPRGKNEAVAYRDFMADLEKFANKNGTLVITGAQQNKKGGVYQIGDALPHKATVMLELKPRKLMQRAMPWKFDGIDYLYTPGKFEPKVPVHITKGRDSGPGVFDLLYVGPRYLWTDIPEGFDRQTSGQREMDL